MNKVKEGMVGFFSQKKSFRNFALLRRFVKLFSVKIYFLANKYRASGRGALGFPQIHKTSVSLLKETY